MMLKLLFAFCFTASHVFAFRSISLGKKMVNARPRWLSGRVASPGNGSNIPDGGAVWPTAIYWTTVQVGTPARDFPVAIDSGSGDLDIGGRGCEGCVTTAPNNPYDPSNSSTAKPAFPFTFSNSYQTCDLKNPTAVCSIHGKLYTDQVSLVGYGPTKVTVGAIERQDTNFDQFKAIDGVMGFTMGGDKNVFASLVKAGHCDNVWAMCMYEGSKSNGTLTIGGADPRLSVDGKVSYVPDSGRGFHEVRVQSLQLTFPTAGGNTQGVNVDTIPIDQSAILDTGTNILLLGSSVYKKVREQMCSKADATSCAELWNNKCLSLTDKVRGSYPSLALVLEDGVTLDMTSDDYLLLGSPLASTPDQYCLGIRNGGNAGGSGFIIGDTTMRHYYLVFDLAEKKIGWGPVNKETCGSI